MKPYIVIPIATYLTGGWSMPMTNRPIAIAEKLLERDHSIRKSKRNDHGETRAKPKVHRALDTCV